MSAPDVNKDFSDKTNNEVVKQAQAFRAEDAISSQSDKFVASVEKLSSYLDKVKEVEDRNGQQRLEGFQKKLSMVGGAVSALASSSKELQQALQPISAVLQTVNGAIMMWIQTSQNKKSTSEMLEKIEHAIKNTKAEMDTLSKKLGDVDIKPTDLVSEKILKDIGFDSKENTSSENQKAAKPPALKIAEAFK